MDLEDLLAATAESPPCGPNLEYDQALLDLEQAARVKPEGALGEPSVEPQWPEVSARAERLLRRSKDLRVAVLLTRAQTNMDGLPGLARGLAVLAGLLERYWLDVHPRPDGDDMTSRLNVLAALGDANPDDGLVRDTRRTYLVKSREHGAVRVRDLEVSLSRLSPRPGEQALSADLLRAQLGAAFNAEPVVPRSVAESRVALSRIRAALGERIGVERVPDFKPLEDLLGSVEAFAPVDGDANVVVGAGGDLSTASAQMEPNRSGPGVVRSREDAIRMLELVSQYLEQNEPSHPAPLLIRRAQRLMTKNFVEIVRDLIPDGIKQVETLAGGLGAHERG